MNPQWLGFKDVFHSHSKYKNTHYGGTTVASDALSATQLLSDDFLESNASHARRTLMLNVDVTLFLRSG